jgi:hypothetical protein
MLALMLLLLAPPADARAREAVTARDDAARRWREACVVGEPQALPTSREADDRREGHDRERGEGHRRDRPAFSAARTIDLGLEVELRSDRFLDPRRPRVRSIELRLYTPKGHLYQTLTLSPPSAAARRRPQHHATGWTGTLPVAGTAIVNHSLYGRWTVQPYLAGRPEPCGDAASMWIVP